MKQTEIFYKQFEKDGKSYVKIIKIKNVAKMKDLPYEYTKSIPIYYSVGDLEHAAICIVDANGIKYYLHEGEFYPLYLFATLVLTMRNAGERLHKIIKEINKIRMVRI